MKHFLRLKSERNRQIILYLFLICTFQSLFILSRKLAWVIDVIAPALNAYAQFSLGISKFNHFPIPSRF